MAGDGHAIAVIPLERNTFDALFNGRSGYRAQYTCAAIGPANPTHASLLLPPTMLQICILKKNRSRS
jgi:hypothetical protein